MTSRRFRSFILVVSLLIGPAMFALPRDTRSAAPPSAATRLMRSIWRFFGISTTGDTLIMPRP